MKLGQILAVIDCIPVALDDVPHASAPDFSLVAARLEHAARCVRVLAECQSNEARHSPTRLPAIAYLQEGRP